MNFKKNNNLSSFEIGYLKRIYNISLRLNEKNINRYSQKQIQKYRDKVESLRTKLSESLESK